MEDSPEDGTPDAEVDIRDSCCFEGRYFWDALKAIVARQLFFLHALTTIWRLTEVSGSATYWLLASSFSLQLAETLVILVWKRAQEWKWFQPAVLCYLVCVIPPIWILELDNLGISKLNPIRTINNTLEPFVQNCPAQDKGRPSNYWLIALEQSLPLCVILSRWIIPKGSLSYDQLSQLLLSHLATGCDIVDFFSILSEVKVRNHRPFSLMVLVIWTLSLTQFCIVCTARRTFSLEDETLEDSSEDEAEGQEVINLHRKVRIDDCAVAVPVATGSDVERKRKWKQRWTHGLREFGTVMLETDAWSTTLSLVLQDGPFLFIRAASILCFRILTYTNCFFAAKNLLVLILQVYHVYSVYKDQRQTREDSRKARKDMWLVKVQFLDYPDPKRLKKEAHTLYHTRYFKF